LPWLTQIKGHKTSFTPCKGNKIKEHIMTWTLNRCHTHIHTQPFYGSMDFVQDNPGEPVPEETVTHSHLPWSSIIPYLLHPSTTIHGILPVQSTCEVVCCMEYKIRWHFSGQRWEWLDGCVALSYRIEF